MSQKISKKELFKWNGLCESIRLEGCGYIDPDTKMDTLYSDGKVVPFIPVHIRNKKCGKPCAIKSFYCKEHKKFLNDHKKGCKWKYVLGQKCGRECTPKSLYCEDHEYYQNQE